jgi:riboflavin-specific deaminase-like protein
VGLPYALVSCAISADGYLDDASPERLVLSGARDLDRVDELRASCDAILVGAGTVRADNPRLRVRSRERRRARVARGLPADPLRVTLTASGDLDPAAAMLGAGALVYCPAPLAAALAARLGGAAEVAGLGEPLSLRAVLTDLASRGVARLLIEGGSHVLTAALQQDLASELHLAVAPFFLGDSKAPRFVMPGEFPQTPARPMTLAEVRRVGEMSVSRYLLGPGGTDERYLAWAVELSKLSPRSDTAFSVGAVVVSAEGEVLATGYSRESDPRDHAEESALRKLGATSADDGSPPERPDPRVRDATVYSSLVPCGVRASRPVTCVRHIVAAGIRRVVYAWDEPPLFAPGDGADRLRDAGVEVIWIPVLADRAARVNAHLLRGDR